MGKRRKYPNVDIKKKYKITKGGHVTENDQSNLVKGNTIKDIKGAAQKKRPDIHKDIVKLAKKLKKGDSITIWYNEYQICEAGNIGTNYKI